MIATITITIADKTPDEFFAAVAEAQAAGHIVAVG